MSINAQTRIALFLPALSAGGAERTILKLANGIAARGYPVDMVLARAVGQYLPDVSKDVRVVDLKARRDIFSLPGLVNYLNTVKPAVLLSGLHTNIVAIAAKRIARVQTRIIVSERNTFSARIRSFSSDFRMRVMPQLIKSFYPLADNIVAVSQGVADDLITRMGIPSSHVVVIYNPVITPELKAKASESIDHPWFAPNQPPVILSVGRLAPQKDFLTLIDAFARIRAVCEARLLILGEGDQRQTLETEIKALGLERTASLPGFIPNPYPFMKKAAVFVLSSKFEGLPGVLIEALYCHTRLVATDCPSGPREILADGNWGQLVPVGNSETMANAIEKALNQEIPIPTEESWNRFELETIVDQYLELFFG